MFVFVFVCAVCRVRLLFVFLVLIVFAFAGFGFGLLFSLKKLRRVIVFARSLGFLVRVSSRAGVFVFSVLFFQLGTARVENVMRLPCVPFGWVRQSGVVLQVYIICNIVSKVFGV